MKVAKAHYKVACVRNNSLNQTTTDIVNNASVVVLEDLNVAGMMKNHNLALAIKDVGFGEFRRQIEYKAKWQGKRVIIADRYFASSKTCSCCGWKNDNLTLKDRVFICLSCGLKIDRDLNAAINLKNYGTVKLTESICQTAEKVCGAGSSVAAMPHSPAAKQKIESLVIN